MTRKELCRRALRERDIVVDFLLTNPCKFDKTALLNLLQRCWVVLGAMETDSDCIIIQTKYTTMKCIKNSKGYATTDDKDIFIKGLGTFTFYQLVDLRGKTNYYLVKLVNYDEGSEPMYYEVETTRTLKQFERTYNRIRNAWFREKNAPCLMEYLHDRLYDEGFAFYEALRPIDLEVVF